MKRAFGSRQLFTQDDFYKSKKVYDFVNNSVAEARKTMSHMDAVVVVDLFGLSDEFSAETKKGSAKKKDKAKDSKNSKSEKLPEENVLLMLVGVEWPIKHNEWDEDVFEEKALETPLEGDDKFEVTRKRIPIKKFTFCREIHHTVYFDERMSLLDRIKNFVYTPYAYRDFDEAVCSRILGQENLSQVTFNVFQWLKGLAEGRKNTNNVILAAPSGCGKTETYRVIKEILEEKIGTIPVIQLDTSRLTMEGFVGMDIEEFFAPLMSAGTDGIGIVILDELDKRLVPQYDSKGQNINATIQGQLLTVIEGTILRSVKDIKHIDTSNTLFIGAGAFQQIRESIKEKNPRVVGFGNLHDEKLLEQDLTMEVLMNEGVQAEFAGRFTSVINYHRLDRECVAQIVQRYADDISKQLHVKLELTEETIDYLYGVYENSPLGCRVLRSKMWETISPYGIAWEREGLLSKHAPLEVIYDAKEGCYLSA